MIALVLACVVAAQGAPSPTRPRLPGGADRNDWQAYFDRGADILAKHPNEADSLFYWAHRLDPSRAEPLYGRWIAFWMKDIGRFEHYLDDDPRVLQSPAVLATDSLFLRAMHRNPFVPRTLIVVLLNQLPGSWDDSPYTRGWLAYSRRQYSMAASYFGQMSRNDRYLWMRFTRALTFIPQEQYDSAAAEMNTLYAKLKARADTGLSPIYESLEMLSYAIGLLDLVRGYPDSARRSFERAVEENLGFFPAHMELGELALGRFNRAVAERDFRQGAELAPDDAWTQDRLGAGLLRMGKAVDAIVPLERAVALEPWYAEPRLLLGRAWDGAGDKDAAAKAYQQFLEVAPRRDTASIHEAERRLAVLRGRSN